MLDWKNVCLGLSGWLIASGVWAQQTTIQVPTINTGGAFYEQFGVSWGLQGRNWFFNGPEMAPPPFGGFDPNSGARVGFGFGGGGVRGQFSLYAAQGSSRSISGTSGVLTLPNGGFGTVIDSTYRPFITQITPVLGESSVAKILREHGVPRIPYRAEEPPQSVQVDTSPAGQIKTARSTSSAEQGAASLSEIRRQLAAEDAAREAEFQQILDEAQALETQGDFKGAASVYARAALRKEGSERDKLLQYSRDLRKKGLMSG